MKIVCPTCEATYEVPEAVLTSKRAVRCARCNNDWVPGDHWQPDTPTSDAHSESGPQAATPSPAPEPASAEPAPPAPQEFHATAPDPGAPPPAEPADLPPAAARLRQTAASAFADPAPGEAADSDQPPTRQPMSAWIVSIAALLALGVLAVLLRAQVMQIWPASERVYAVLGLAQR